MPAPSKHQPNPAECLQVTVDKAAFLELGRVFKRVYRPMARPRNVTLTLAPGSLRIEFDGGGCEFPCQTSYTLIAVLTPRVFAGIITDHQKDKDPTGAITLTFRFNPAAFATPLSGGPAIFLQPPTPLTTPT